MSPAPLAQLTPKQQRFCSEYLVDQNATQAARRAGFSARTARQQGARLLSNVAVRAEIDRRLAEAARRADLTAEEVAGMIKKILCSDPRRLRGPNGRLLRLEDIPEDLASVVSVELDEEGAVASLKTPDKIKAAALAAKMKGLLDSDVTINVNIGFSERLRAAREKRLKSKGG